MLMLFAFFIIEENDGSSTHKEEYLLAVELAKGTKQAYETIYNKYRDSLYLFVYRQFYDEEQAMNIVQETFTRLYASRDKIKPDKGIKSYIFTIAINQCHSHKRKKDYKKIDSIHKMEEDRGVFIKDKSHSPEKRSILNEMEDFLLRTLNGLPEKQKNIILMKKTSNMTYDEIGSSMGFSKRHVKRLANMAITEITEAFNKAGYTNDGRFTL